MSPAKVVCSGVPASPLNLSSGPAHSSHEGERVRICCWWTQYRLHNGTQVVVYLAAHSLAGILEAVQTSSCHVLMKTCFRKYW